MTTSLIDRLRSKMIASCQCMTKTPDPQHHTESCLYRILYEAYTELDQAAKADLRTFGASDKVCYKYPGEDQTDLRKAYLSGVYDSIRGTHDYWDDPRTERVAYAICLAGGGDPDAMTWITEGGIQQPYGPRYMHCMDEAAAAIAVLKDKP
jgi:hypothetical protein